MLCSFIIIFSHLLFAGEGVNITHGPILGQLGAHHIGIWTRTSQPGRFKLCYGFHPNSRTQNSPSAVTTLDHDNTGLTLNPIFWKFNYLQVSLQYLSRFHHGKMQKMDFKCFPVDTISFGKYLTNNGMH